MTDILERLLDLNEMDRGAIDYEPYNFKDLAYEAAEEINRLRFQIEALEKVLTAYMTAQRPKAAKKD